MIDAKFIAKALHGHKSGSGFVARCPAHNDRNPSLSIRDGHGGKVLIKCHKGCSQADVLAELKSRHLWPDRGRRPFMRGSFKATLQPQDPPPSELGFNHFARSIWEAAEEANDTLVSTYLLSRGITHYLPKTLRFSSALKHPSGQKHPAMIGLVTSGIDNTPIGIHRTYLAHDGKGKASLPQTKLMLGQCGGGAVRIQDATDLVMVGEGIETCLSAMQSTGIPAWAALSTSGMKALMLPKAIKEVIILVDGDEAGEVAAQSCAARWKQEGRRVKLARPPKGSDFNDMLISGVTKCAGDHHD
jgi:hypothetical protein